MLSQIKTIKLHNDFYKLNIGSWNALEQNIFFGILANCYEHNQIEFTFTLADLNSFVVGHRLTANEMLKQVLSLEKNIFKLDFTLIKSVNANLHQRQKLNLFSSFEIRYDGKKDDFDNGKLKELKIKINPDFAYLIQNIKQNYTEYDLQEFLAIKGKYTRTLYQNLKKFRSTGKLYVKWDNFLNLMGIPQTYQSGDIEKRILKPSIKSLSNNFKNLVYTKIKQKGRGRGGKVVAIEFVFNPQMDMYYSHKSPSNTYNRKSSNNSYNQSKSTSNSYSHKPPNNSYNRKSSNNSYNQKSPSNNTYNYKSPSDIHSETWSDDDTTNHFSQIFQKVARGPFLDKLLETYEQRYRGANS